MKTKHTVTSPCLKPPFSDWLAPLGVCAAEGVDSEKWSLRKLLGLSLSLLLSACGGGGGQQEAHIQPESQTSSRAQAMAAAGNTVSCAYKVMAVVAHQDDDIWFMPFDLQAHVKNGACVQLIYSTNGKPDGQSFAYALGRIKGNLTAWSFMNSEAMPAPESWSREVLTVGNHKPIKYTSQNGKLTKIFLNLNDSWLGSGGWGSLTPVAQMEHDTSYTAQAYPDLRDLTDINQVASYALASKEDYSRSDFVATLGQLIKDFDPAFYYTQDATITGSYESMQWGAGEGKDHPSHIATAKMAVEAAQASSSRVLIQSMVDYPIQVRELNSSASEQEFHRNLMYWYGPWDVASDIYNCSSSTAGAQPKCSIGSQEELWIGKQYIANAGKDAPSGLIMPAQMSGFQANELIVAYVGAPSKANYSPEVQTYRDSRLHILNTAKNTESVFEGRFAGSPSIVTGGDQRVSAFARTSEGRVAYIPSKAAGGWWGVLYWTDKVMTSDPVAIRQADGRLAVMAIDATGTLVYRGEVSTGSTWDAQWISTGVTQLANQNIQLGLDASGRVTAFVRHLDGTASIVTQANPGWASFSVSKPSVVSQAAEVGLQFIGNAVTISWLDRTAGALRVSSASTTTINSATVWSAAQIAVPASAQFRQHRLANKNGTVMALGVCGSSPSACLSSVTANSQAQTLALLPEALGSASSANRFVVLGRSATQSVTLIEK